MAERIEFYMKLITSKNDGAEENNWAWATFDVGLADWTMAECVVDDEKVAEFLSDEAEAERFHDMLKISAIDMLHVEGATNGHGAH